MLIFLAIICTFLGTIYLWYENVYKIDKCLKRYPGPKTIPILGNVLQIGNRLTMFENLLKFRKQYGGIYTLKIGPIQPNLVVTDLKALEFILKSNILITKGTMYKNFKNWLGQGLITSTGEKWKQHRKILTPGFHFQILEQFIPVFNSATNILIKKLNDLIDKESINIPNILSLCTMDIICESSMNINMNAQQNPTSEYVKCVHDMCKIVVRRTYSPIKIIDFLYRFTKDYRDEQQMLKILHGQSMSIVKDRRKTFNKNNINDNDGKRRRYTFIDILLQAYVNGKPLSDEDVREEVDNFLFAGHDTVAATMAFALYCLSKNQEIQEKIVDELKMIFGDDTERPATLQELNDMKYLDMVIKETLRMYPAGPIISRKLEEDIKYDGGIWPKGLNLIIFIYGVHRNPENYPDPEKFDPERFAPENCVDSNPFSYIPFSAGPRNCIGQKYAMLEIKSIFSKLFRHFKILRTIPDHNLMLINAVLASANGILIKIEKRKFDSL